jgi:hypothetical protein
MILRLFNVSAQLQELYSIQVNNVMVIHVKWVRKYVNGMVAYFKIPTQLLLEETEKISKVTIVINNK